MHFIWSKHIGLGIAVDGDGFEPAGGVLGEVLLIHTPAQELAEGVEVLIDGL